MPDIFDFISTRVDVEPPIKDVSVPLLPTVAADLRPVDESLLGVGNGLNPNGKITTSGIGLMDGISQRIQQLKDNRPAYNYTAQQENRYSNPNLQFTPTNILDTDTEDIYGRNQAFYTQWMNALVKTSANAVGTFASSFLTIPRQLDAVRSGNFNQLFSDDGMFEGVQNWLTNMEDVFPNYYTQYERDHPYLSAIMPTGMANFWGDKVIKNIGFSVGGLAAGAVTDVALEFATEGLATPVVFVNAANQIGRFLPNLFRGFRNLNKVATYAGGADEVMNAAKSTKNLYQALNLPTIKQIGTGGRFALTTYMGAQGESFIEGYHTYLDTKKQLYEQALGAGDTSKDTLSSIESRAQQAGKYTTALNLPLLAISNMVQFPNLLYGKAAFAEAVPWLKLTLGENGLQAVSEYSMKKNLTRWLSRSFISSLPEGLEEAGQYFVGNSIRDYYLDRKNVELNKSLFGYMMGNVPHVLADEQMYQEAFLGALSGFLMTGGMRAFSLHKDQGRHTEIANEAQRTLDRFNNAINQFSANIDLQNADENSKDIAAHKALYSVVHSGLKLGTFDSFMDWLQDAKTVDLNEFNKSFKTDFKTDLEKNAFVDSLISESNAQKQDIQRVNQVFPKNPYTKSYLTRKIKNAFSPKSVTELNNIQERLFDDYKEVMGFNESMLRVTKGKSAMLKGELKNLGIKDEAIDYLARLHTPKSLGTYLTWKKAQLDLLSRQVEYHDRLKSAASSTNPLTPEMKEDIDKTEKVHKQVTNYMAAMNALHEKLKEDPTNETIRDLITKLALTEETSEDQVNRYMSERQRKLDEAAQNATVEDNLTAENEDLNSDDSQTAEELVNIAEQSQQENQPTVPVAPFGSPPEDNTQQVVSPTSPSDALEATAATFDDGTPIEPFAPIDDKKKKKNQVKASMVVSGFGTETFTLEEIKQQPDAFFVFADDSIDVRDFICYTVNGDRMVSFRVSTRNGVSYFGAAKQSALTDEQLEGHLFKQVLNDKQATIVKEKEQASIVEQVVGVSSETDLENKKKDIERRRQKSINGVFQTGDGNFWVGNFEAEPNRQINNSTDKEELVERINKIYDAELKALEKEAVSEPVTTEQELPSAFDQFVPTGINPYLRNIIQIQIDKGAMTIQC